MRGATPRRQRRLRGGAFTVAVHRPPADLAQRRPWWTRQQADTVPAAQAALRGHEIAWLITGAVRIDYFWGAGDLAEQ